MTKILLVGCGNVGSRHLQALAKTSTPLKILAVDTNEESLKLAKSRFYEIPTHSNHEIDFLHKIPRSENVDWCIIATDARHRRNILEIVANDNKIKFLLLEKILFTERADYDLASKFLRDKNITAYVNHPLVEMNDYINIGNLVTGLPIKVEIFDGSFGLMTTVLHYLELIKFLYKQTNFTVDTARLIPSLVESKRSSYYELYGELLCKFANFNLFFHFKEELPKERMLIFTFPSHVLKIKVLKDGFELFENQTLLKEGRMEYVHQSSLTHRYIEKSERKEILNLPLYENAKLTHLTLLDEVSRFLKSNNIQTNEEFPFT